MVHQAVSLEQIVNTYQQIQDEICKGLEEVDGFALFEEDQWNREEGGGGKSRVIGGGQVFEKGGVNFSHVHGPMPEKISSKLQLPVGLKFHATGVSIVIHPESPKVPIIHMNIRYFEMENGTYWFGGGIDLTPIYVVPEDAIFFHKSLKAVCDQFHPDYYPRFKSWCDDYFTIKHRNEMRGIGGIFYDHLHDQDPEKRNQLFEFSCAVGRAFVPTYREIVNRHKHEPFADQEKDWQLLRRGRYVEFNLVYDKGTKFGLDTGGRIESILMSMPPLAQWKYNYQPEPESAEAKTLAELRPQEWASM